MSSLISFLVGIIFLVCGLVTVYLSSTFVWWRLATIVDMTKMWSGVGVAVIGSAICGYAAVAAWNRSKELNAKWANHIKERKLAASAVTAS